MKRVKLMIIVLSALLTAGRQGLGDDTLLNLGPEEIVEANGVAIEVPGYSVPSFVDWNNDKLKDLIIGEGGYDGGSTYPGKVRVYLNVGTESNPQFSDYFYVQCYGSDLTCVASGCMGCFPRVVYWDADERKDLLIGQTDGTVRIFLNVGTDTDPNFASSAFLKLGTCACSWTNIDVGDRATPTVADCNNDGKKDLIVGALDGKIHIFLNGGTDTEPLFPTETFAQADGADLIVPGIRSSPVILDLDGDGKKDLLTGNTEGQLLFYSNAGADASPTFTDYSLVEANSIPIDLPGSPRSRPYVCYWTGDGHFGPIDGYPDVLIGATDGKMHLYRGKPVACDIDADGRVDLSDFTSFAAYWREPGCGQCGGADFTADGNVDIDDLRRFAANWLFGFK